MSTANSFNPFTQQQVPYEFTDLSYNANVKLNKQDSVYYAVLAFPQELDKRLIVDPLSRSINVPEEQYAFIPKVSKPNEDEIAFLKGICMAVERDDGYYIHHFATQLYDKQKGVFTHITKSDDTMLMTSSGIETLVFLFIGFVLPGLYWQAYHALHHPVTEIYDNKVLITHMLSIEEEWLNLNKTFAAHE